MADPGVASACLGDPKVDISEKQTLLAVLQFLKKHNLKETEALLKQEAKVSDEECKNEDAGPSASEVSHALAAYKSDDDPTLYEDLYTDIKGFIDSCLDVHKVELATILYPVFVHMYLELVYNGHEIHARNFFGKFSLDQEEYYKDDLMKLSTVFKKEQMTGNQLMDNFKSSKFVIRMSRDSYTHLKRHLQEKQLSRLLNIIQEHLFIDVFDGVPRNKQQIDASSGGLLGESDRDANKVKVLYGLLKEPDLNIPLDEDEDTTEGEGDKPKKKKPKKDPLLMKKSKNDPNAPPNTRIPLPELKDMDKVEKVTAYREAMKRIKIDKDHLPSVCFYTLLNSCQGATCIEITDDSSLMSVGFSDSFIRIWSLNTEKLRAMKPPNDLEIIDREADDVLERMMEERSAVEIKTLSGHSGPVYAISFSPDKHYLVSASADGTIRLWSLLTWTNLVCYKGHNYPVWDVKFSPHGHYFVSSGHDRTARLWSTDHYQPLRIFAGHLSDVDTSTVSIVGGRSVSDSVRRIMRHTFDSKLASQFNWYGKKGKRPFGQLKLAAVVQTDPAGTGYPASSVDNFIQLSELQNNYCLKHFEQCVQFHPNSNYVATGSSDKLIRLWDVLNGSCVRVMSGHKGAVQCLCFSPDGRTLASSGVDQVVILWDLASGIMMGQMKGHTSTVYSLCFSRDGTVLSSGGLDMTVRIWDIKKIHEEMDTDTDANIPSTLQVVDSPSLLIVTYKTKSTPVLCLHFTRRNLLLGSGAFSVT